MAPTACKRTVSGSISLFYSKCFSPFPHGTGSLSVSREYLALRDGPRGFRQGFSCPALLRILLTFIKMACTGLSPFIMCLSKQLPVLFIKICRSPTTPKMHRYIFGLGCCAFARHYLRNHFCFLFLRVLRCFSSPRLPPN